MRGITRDATFRFTMPGPEALPESERPTFELVVPRLNTTKALRERVEGLLEMETPAAPDDPSDETAAAAYRAKRKTAEQRATALYDEMYAIVRDHVVGWSNVATPRGEPLDFSQSDLGDAIDEEGLIVLAEVLRNATVLKYREKKASGSPSPSPTAAPVAGAPGGASEPGAAGVLPRSSAPDATGPGHTTDPASGPANGSSASIAAAAGGSTSAGA